MKIILFLLLTVCVAFAQSPRSLSVNSNGVVFVATNGGFAMNGLILTNSPALASKTGRFDVLTFGGQSRSNWPAVPVQSVNGATGAVVIPIPFMLAGSNIVWQRSGTNWTPQIVGTLPAGLIPNVVTSNAVIAAIGQPFYPSQFTSGAVVSLIGQPFYTSQLTSNAVTAALGQSPLYSFTVTSNAVVSAIGQPFYPSQFTSNAVIALIGQPMYPEAFTSQAVVNLIGQPLYTVTSNAVIAAIGQPFYASQFTSGAVVSLIGQPYYASDFAAAFTSNAIVGKIGQPYYASDFAAAFTSNSIVGKIGQPYYASDFTAAFTSNSIVGKIGQPFYPSQFTSGAVVGLIGQPFYPEQFTSGAVVSLIGQPMYAEQVNTLLAGYASLTAANAFAFNQSMPGLVLTNSYSNYWVEATGPTGQIYASGNVGETNILFDGTDVTGYLQVGQFIRVYGEGHVLSTIDTDHGTVTEPWAETYSAQTVFTQAVATVSPSITFPTGYQTVAYSNNVAQFIGLFGYTPAAVGSVTQGIIELLGGTPNVTINTNATTLTISVAETPVPVQSVNGATGAVSFTIVNSFNGQTGAVVQPIVTSFNGETGAVSFAPSLVNSFNGQTGSVLQPIVTGFNGQTGSVLQPIVTSFNGQTGAVVQPIVTSVNGATGAVVVTTGFTNYGANIIPLSGSTVLLDFAVSETNYAFSLGLNNAQTTLILTNLPTVSRLVPMRITATCGVTGTIVLPPFLYFVGTVPPPTNCIAGSNYVWSFEALLSNRVEGIFVPVQP